MFPLSPADDQLSIMSVQWFQDNSSLDCVIQKARARLRDTVERSILDLNKALCNATTEMEMNGSAVQVLNKTSFRSTTQIGYNSIINRKYGQEDGS